MGLRPTQAWPLFSTVFSYYPPSGLADRALEDFGCCAIPCKVA